MFVCVQFKSITSRSFFFFLGLSHGSLGFQIGMSLVGQCHSNSEMSCLCLSLIINYLCLQSTFVYVYTPLSDMEQVWLHWSASRCSAALTKQMFLSALKAPSISQIDCKWHLTKWLIRVVVSSLLCRHYPIRQILPSQGETKLGEKDQEHSTPHLNEMN